MFELFFLMLAVSIQAAQPPSSTASVAVPAPVTSEATSVATDKDPVPDKEPVEEAVATPTFLAPSPAPEITAETEAPPAFLAPAAPALKAEPQVPTGRFTTATEVKPILNATRGNWIMVRDFNGQDLVYVTQIWSWRCGLLELKVGINGATPETWPLPPCHEDQATPNTILETDGLPYRAFPKGSVAMVEVQMTFDDLTTDGGKFNRQGMPIP